MGAAVRSATAAPSKRDYRAIHWAGASGRGEMKVPGWNNPGGSHGSNNALQEFGKRLVSVVTIGGDTDLQCISCETRRENGRIARLPPKSRTNSAQSNTLPPGGFRHTDKTSPDEQSKSSGLRPAFYSYPRTAARNKCLRAGLERSRPCTGRSHVRLAAAPPSPLTPSR